MNKKFSLLQDFLNTSIKFKLVKEDEDSVVDTPDAEPAPGDEQGVPAETDKFSHEINIEPEAIVVLLQYLRDNNDVDLDSIFSKLDEINTKLETVHVADIKSMLDIDAADATTDSNDNPDAII